MCKLASLSNILYNDGMKYAIFKTEEYTDWYNEQSAKAQGQIEKRLSMIETEGFFGTKKDLEDGLWELKWKNGRRLYYVYIPEESILLLCGGNKNGQNKDITQARKIFKKYIHT
jgi:putative addiction module killer protein